MAAAQAEIWVAKGVYYPDQGSGQINNALTSTFMMADGVALIGGFNYSDNDITDQDPVHNVTVLSGDIDWVNGGQDITDANGVVITTTNIISNNANHVVSAIGVSGTAVLDGFTITAGQANGTLPDYWGGRFLCDGSEGKNCNPALMNIIFVGNFADNAGGAMFNNGKNGIRNPTLTNITFYGNSVKCCGGAMYKLGQGGGSSSILTNDVFSGSSAFRNGGGMYNYSYNGGTSKPILSNVTFSGNSAGGFGGAMVNDGENTGTSIPELCNSIVWNNLDSNGTGTISASISLTKRASISLTYSLVQGSGVSSGSWIGGSYVDSGGNIDSDPLYVETIDPSIAHTTTGNLRLREISPAIDQGDDSFTAGILTDLDGEARAVDGNLDGIPTVDMGAYDYQIPYLFDGYIPLIFR